MVRRNRLSIMWLRPTLATHFKCKVLTKKKKKQKKKHLKDKTPNAVSACRGKIADFHNVRVSPRGDG